jgi:hypothetical protein
MFYNYDFCKSLVTIEKSIISQWILGQNQATPGVSWSRLTSTFLLS